MEIPDVLGTIVILLLALAAVSILRRGGGTMSC